MGASPRCLSRLHRAGKPIQNAYAESFNGKLRDECLNENWFVDLDDAQGKIEIWRLDYNAVRPHSTLGDLSPLEYEERFKDNATGPGLSDPAVV